MTMNENDDNNKNNNSNNNSYEYVTSELEPCRSANGQEAGASGR